MLSLIRTIGPAPNEMGEEELLTKIKKERTRVSKALALIKFQPAKKKTKSTRKKSSGQKSIKKFVDQNNEVFELLKKMGMTPQELIKKAKEKKNGEKD